MYADPTPSALQVFLSRPGESQSNITGLPSEQGHEQGIWINADPIPGCVVCNIGESKFHTLFLVMSAEPFQCGKSGQTVCIDRRCTVSSTGGLITGDGPSSFFLPHSYDMRASRVS